MVYGPEDTVPVIVMNIGDKQKVNILVEVIGEAGNILCKEKFENVEMQEGRSVTAVADMKLPKLPDGLYTFQYIVYV